jgi:hypothetical protein
MSTEQPEVVYQPRVEKTSNGTFIVYLNQAGRPLGPLGFEVKEGYSTKGDDCPTMQATRLLET